MSNKLIDERPLVVLPSLAKQVGITKAIILQQIHYYTQGRDATVSGGFRWVRGSYQEIAQMCCDVWEWKTIRNNVQELEKEGFLISASLSSDRFDRTKSYRCNAEKLATSQGTENGSFDIQKDDTEPKTGSHDEPKTGSLNNDLNSGSSLILKEEDSLLCVEGKHTQPGDDLQNPSDSLNAPPLPKPKAVQKTDADDLAPKLTKLEQAIADVCLIMTDVMTPVQYSNLQAVAAKLKKIGVRSDVVPVFREFWQETKPTQTYNLRPAYVLEHWGAFSQWLSMQGE